MPDEEDIRKLLSLKRYEQPPQEYFDKFLRDFQRRQRSELLRQPLWKIALDRLHVFVGEHNVGRYAYAGATAMVLAIATVTSVKIVTTSRETAIADAGRQPGLREFGQSRVLANGFQNIQPSAQTAFARPHYVIDARPVSYEAPVSF